MPARLFKVTLKIQVVSCDPFKWVILSDLEKRCLKSLKNQVHDAGVTDHVGKTMSFLPAVWEW